MSQFKKKSFIPQIKSKSLNNIRLNKYIANSGHCSRRDADELIKSGKVKVNNEVVTEMGYNVNTSASVSINGKKISLQQNQYYLINKPKDFISTTKDEKGRKTVVNLIKDKEALNVSPIGRLDRNTTGVLILTNDGELTYALTHPSAKVEKIYKAILNKPLSAEHFNELVKGIELEDGITKPDELVILENGKDKEIGIVLNSGKNRVIHRMFEALGYEVVYLDRTSFAGITKRNLKRGQYRKLTIREISVLKQFEKRIVQK